MKTYFIDNKIIYSWNSVPPIYDFFKENLTDEQLSLIGQWCVFQINEETGEDELVPPEWREEIQNQKLFDLKSQECKEVILSRYSLIQQINIMVDSPEEKTEMRSWINSVRNELHTNGKDADFSQFIV